MLAASDVGLDLVVPPELEAGEPPEVRAGARDEVRMLVSWRDDPRLVHARFRDLERFVARGDVLVVNTSGTLKAALPALRDGGQALELHLSTRLPGGLWVVEVRRPDGIASRPFREARAGEVLHMPAGGTARLLAPFPYNVEGRETAPPRLWHAALRLPGPLHDYLESHGEPIRYAYARGRWPIEAYQTVFATEPGSAEMPSAARPFTPELVARLVARGVQFAPVLLHTGVASLESPEPPYEESYRVERESASLVNAARAAGRRVVAVGTTAVRALETVADETGTCHPGKGWTRLVISSARPPRAVDAVLTGLHEPHATHLSMLAAFAGGGAEQLRRTYAEALRAGYLWHEFGDVHLMLNGHPPSGLPLRAPEVREWGAGKRPPAVIYPRRHPMASLASKKCVPCRGGVPPLKGEKLHDLLGELNGERGGWRVVGNHHLEKDFGFKDFREALAFVNRVGELAEEEGHHPDLHLTWGKVTMTTWTHKINGLTESDFILAAKADGLA